MSYLTLKDRITVKTQTARTIEGVEIPVATTFSFVEVLSITTSQSVENFTNTASFSLPKGIRIKYTDNEGNLLRLPPERIFGAGDVVKIEMWCQIPVINTQNPSQAKEINSKENYKATFTGYITRVHTGKEIVFECEDEMWLFKRNSRLFPDDFLTGRKIGGKVIDAKPIEIYDVDTRSYKPGNTIGSVTSYDPKKTSVEEVLKSFFEGQSYTTTDTDTKAYTLKDVQSSEIELSGYRSEGIITLVQFFDDLKKFSSSFSYWRKGKLYIGPRSWPEFQTSSTPFAFQQNIIEGDDLKFQRKEEIKYRVEIINIKDGKQEKLANGKQEYFGDAEGEIRQVFVHGKDLTKKGTLEQLQLQANAEMDKLKYTGFTGSFTTFGVPVVYHGDKVQLYDPDDHNLERNGMYIVTAVDREFNASSASYRQKITLGMKADL